MGQSQSVKSMHDGICLKTLAFSPLGVRAADAYAGNKPWYNVQMKSCANRAFLTASSTKF